MKRLLAYLKPHKWVMTAATVLVLFIIVVELYRPIVIGDAIDDYINGYYAPYIETTADAPGAVPYHDTYLTRDFEAADGQNYDQILLYNNQYYMAENLSSEECDALKNADAATLSSYVNQSATPLTRDDLKDLRHYDFAGILKAAALYLLLLLTGFVLNALDTWILQKMGQEIIYQMREEVFTHIHSLSLNFFNNTPVGKLVTRVSNDTEAVNELFSTILVKLFKNIVKIIGYAVVMLSINVKMALVSFALLPLVTVLTFFFRFMRPLIEHGYVYSAVPPLYKLTRGRTTRVAYSDEQRDEISAELRGGNPNVKVDISRFKGLGEMDPHELWETTMDPEKRTLRRITLEDASLADDVFSVLMGEEVEPRREWIETNAKYVVNLDI